MLTIKKYAAIDIGSNAIRLLISNVIEQPNKTELFKKSALIRVPIRLGTDVFINGTISDENKQRMMDTMLAFRLLMKAHKVVSYKACATSAMREASNGTHVAAEITKQTKIKIDIINGDEEAAIIAATDIQQYINVNKTYLYVDVGGGSTEFTVIYQGQKVTSKSFKIGTVRLLNNMVEPENWADLEQWTKSQTHNFDSLDMIGTGGNINKTFKLSGKAAGKPLTYFYLMSFYNMLQKYTYEERITKLDLNQDRADVIIPAIKIYLSAMKWSGAKAIYVPKIGLSDGIIKSIYYKTVPCTKLL